MIAFPEIRRAVLDAPPLSCRVQPQYARPHAAQVTDGISRYLSNILDKSTLYLLINFYRNRAFLDKDAS
jgi:hypothetical protein